ncbi:MAG: magnesium/cobalt transporter CorA [Armatimonadota bacterium]
MTITLLHYTPQDFEEKQLSTPDEAAVFIDRPGVLWLHVQGLDDPPALERLAELFRLHPLALEDVLNGPQRPKAEEYEEQDFIITHAVTADLRTHHLRFRQFAIFVGENYLISLHDDETQVVEHVRERIRSARGLIRRHGVDHLMYSLLDGLIDGYFPVLEDFGEYLERIQDEALLLDYPNTLRDIQRAKHELLHLRRVVWPQRDLLNVLMRDDNNTVSGPVRHYLRDCYDHVVQLMDMIETYREMSSDLMDAYMSAISNRTNAVMKVLTIIATIFMPLTFIVGLYGMNFNPEVSRWNMPELNWKYGYPATWAVMIVVTVLMLLYFRRRGWIGRADAPTEKDFEPEEAAIPPRAR